MIDSNKDYYDIGLFQMSLTSDLIIIKLRPLLFFSDEQTLCLNGILQLTIQVWIFCYDDLQEFQTGPTTSQIEIDDDLRFGQDRRKNKTYFEYKMTHF